MIDFLVRFFKGHLAVQIKGRNMHRFLNLCITYGINIWNLDCKEREEMHFHILLPEYKKIRPFVHKTHVKCVVEKKRGLPFTINRYKKRTVFVSVLFFCIIMIYALSLRIWKIDVTGNSSISEEVILEYLKENKVGYGTPKKEINNDALELALRKDFDSIIWSSIYQKGTKLVVCVQEKMKSAKAQNSSSYDENTRFWDLVASKDAVIYSIITRSGTPVVREDEVVKKGELLVSARQEILGDDGEVKELFYRNADAEVYGKTSYYYEEWLPGQEMVLQRSGEERNHYFLVVGNKELHLPTLFLPYEQYERVEVKYQLNLFDLFYFPVFFGKTTDYEKEFRQVSYTKEEVKQQATLHLQQFIQEMEENGVSILEKNVMIEKVDENYHIYGTIWVSEPVSVPKEMPKKQSEDEES